MISKPFDLTSFYPKMNNIGFVFCKRSLKSMEMKSASKTSPYRLDLTAMKSFLSRSQPYNNNIHCLWRPSSVGPTLLLSFQYILPSPPSRDSQTNQREREREEGQWGSLPCPWLLAPRALPLPPLGYACCYWWRA